MWLSKHRTVVRTCPVGLFLPAETLQILLMLGLEGKASRGPQTDGSLCYGLRVDCGKNPRKL